MKSHLIHRNIKYINIIKRTHLTPLGASDVCRYSFKYAIHNVKYILNKLSKLTSNFHVSFKNKNQKYIAVKQKLKIKLNTYLIGINTYDQYSQVYTTQCVDVFHRNRCKSHLRLYYINIIYIKKEIELGVRKLKELKDLSGRKFFLPLLLPTSRRTGE